MVQQGGCRIIKDNYCLCKGVTWYLQLSVPLNKGLEEFIKNSAVSHKT